MVYIKYAFTKTRTYIAIVSIISAIINLRRGNMGAFRIGIIIAVILIFTAIKYLLTDPANYISNWTTTQKYRASQNRIEDAYKEELDCININKDFRTGYYYGLNGETYTTTLKGCTCKDYKECGIPCKHMYHLAKQLGYIKINKKESEK